MEDTRGMPDPQDIAPQAEAPDYLSLVADMTRDFAESRNIDAALGHGLQRISEKLYAEAASLFILDHATGDLVCRACTGPVDIKGLRLARDQGVIGRTVQDAAPQLVTDARNDPDFKTEVDSKTGFETRSILAAPLRVQSETFGAIELINKRGEAFFDTDDAHLLEALAAAAGLAVINARNAEAMAAQAAFQRELALAASIQKSFLPTDREPAFPIHGRNIPARDVSGDFFDIVETRDGPLWFAIGDVAGKGINAALLMARTTSLFRYLAKEAEDPAKVLSAINTELVETAVHGMFVTMACGFYDPRDATVTLANAGHEPALELSASEPDKPCWHGAQTPPLGLIPAIFEASDPGPIRVPITGQRLYLYTDGLTETPGDDGTFLGAEGVAAIIARAEAEAPDGPNVIDWVLNRIKPGEGAPRDDLTLLCVEGPSL